MKQFALASLVLLALLTLDGCEATSRNGDPEPQVKQVIAKVDVDSSGMTTEQRNVSRRLKEDNKPGAIKYLYIVSPFTGDVIFQSTVKGKVTSSGKRLVPATISDRDGTVTDTPNYGMGVFVDGINHLTNEVRGDDGSYGSSVPYIYWWDAFDHYQQHIIGMCDVHISDYPLRIKKAIINLSDYDKPR